MRGRFAKVRDQLVLTALALALSSCGGGSSSSGPVTVGNPPTPTPTPTPSASCSLSTRQNWALAQVNEWYLFPETLSYVNPSGFSNLSDYIDALTATARAQGKDRYFTYVTSIAEEDAYYSSGETGGFGVRMAFDDNVSRVFITEAFEGAPALDAGVDRGWELLAVGPTAGSMRTVPDILASEGPYGVYDALDASDTLAFRFRDLTGATRDVTLTKRVYDIAPVSPRYGLKIIDDNGRKVGYINLRTFIYSAEPDLRDAFAQLKAQGIDDVIIDLRYNGGGLVSVAQTLASLLGGDRHSSDVAFKLQFRPEKTLENETYYFNNETNAIIPHKIAFIGSYSTASASESVMNVFRAYLPSDIALVGDNTYGKPVGQIALDKTECDDRLRLIAVAVVNADGQGGYYDGIAPVMPATCRAEDELDKALGDPTEDSVARALDFLDGRSCTPIGGVTATATASADSKAVYTPRAVLRPLMPEKPTLPQREMPGLF